MIKLQLKLHHQWQGDCFQSKILIFQIDRKKKKKRLSAIVLFDFLHQ